MVIRNESNARNPIESVTLAAVQPGTSQNLPSAPQAPPAVDRATLSSAGTGIAQSTAGPDVRWDKVASIQQAIADGSYDVPASAVASHIVDAMLGKNA